ncbi:hypothetical protein [Sphingomonas panacisoli]|uniref:hypothetical protein n=1 Tax=Sphingomonas panacisoli TaxID=1813879 RepID=UPI001EFF6246|nr:hypothetical protein [Sphingomonas panacisoli]
MTEVETIRAAEDGRSPFATELATLNGVSVSMDLLATARMVLGDLADDLRWDTVARHEALAAGLEVTPSTIDVVDARLLALRKWEDLYDPDRLRSQRHLMEAAALAPLIETDHGIGFEDAAFRELADFVAELPW